MIAAQKKIRVAPQNLHMQCGASLLEGIAYLGIAAIVILGAVSLLTGAFSSAQSNQAGEETTAIRTAVRKLYLGQGYGTVSLNDTLQKAHAFPGTLVPSGAAGAVKNVWGGDVVVTGIGDGTFTIAYPNVPQDVCINTLVSASGWQQVVIGSKNETVFPVPPATAATDCVVGTNTMTFHSL
ncbi:type II secretory pathway pseudopilin PulG [Oxalobacteraceae bacterium GrIS 1.11]